MSTSNLPLSLEVMRERDLNVVAVNNLNGRVYVKWGIPPAQMSPEMSGQYVPSEYEREVAHGCVFYKPCIHQW